MQQRSVSRPEFAVDVLNPLTFFRPYSELDATIEPRQSINVSLETYLWRCHADAVLMRPTRHHSYSLGRKSRSRNQGPLPDVGAPDEFVHSMQWRDWKIEALLIQLIHAYLPTHAVYTPRLSSLVTSGFHTQRRLECVSERSSATLRIGYRLVTPAEYP